MFDSRYEEITNFELVIGRFPGLAHNDTDHLEREKRTVVVVLRFLILGGATIMEQCKLPIQKPGGS